MTPVERGKSGGDVTVEWTNDGARAVVYAERLSIYAVPSMTADDGTVAVGVDCSALAEVIAAAWSLQWNVVDGFVEDCDVIVERESWRRLQRALVGLRNA